MESDFKALMKSVTNAEDEISNKIDILKLLTGKFFYVFLLLFVLYYYIIENNQDKLASLSKKQETVEQFIEKEEAKHKAIQGIF